MRFLIVGIGGSMGSRRCRNLQALGYTDIYGYDFDNKKQVDTCKKYGVHLLEYEEFWNEALDSYNFDAMFVCVPPTKKLEFIKAGNVCEVPVFCEADVQTYDANYQSSSTLRHHPAIRKIKESLDNGTLGKVYTFTHHCGNHIADWHPGADMKTYYAAQKETGACREMFCFELSWLSYLFGDPVDAKAFIDKKLNDPDISADDVYATAVKFSKEVPAQHGLWVGHANESITGTVLIDIVSRPAIRELRIVGEKGTILWNWDNDYIQLSVPNAEDIHIHYERGRAAEGYNKNIPEFMYEQEMKNWIESLQGKAEYLYSREDEKAVISMLRKVEENNG